MPVLIDAIKIPERNRTFFLTDRKSDQICMKGRDIERENEKKIWAQMYLH